MRALFDALPYWLRPVGPDPVFAAIAADAERTGLRGSRGAMPTVVLVSAGVRLTVAPLEESGCVVSISRPFRRPVVVTLTFVESISVSNVIARAGRAGLESSASGRRGTALREDIP